MAGQHSNRSDEKADTAGLGHGEPTDPALFASPQTGRLGRLGRWQRNPKSSTEKASENKAGIIGESLRRQRTERALTLSDIERDTRINRSYLEALEAERWDALPAPIYTRGFLRSYSRYLRLDPEELVSALPTELPQPTGLEPLPGLRRNSITSPSALLNTRVVLMLVIAIVALVLVSQLRGGGDETADSPPTPPAVAAATSPTITRSMPGTTETSDEAIAAKTVPLVSPGTTPNFVGVSLEIARARLTELGFTPAVIEVATATAPAGQIFAQSPEANAPLPKGVTVTLVVSAGSP